MAQPEDRPMGFEDGMLLGTIHGRIIHDGTQHCTGESSDNDTLLGPIDRKMLELVTIEGTMLRPMVRRTDSK